MNILIVEDEPQLSEVLATLMRQNHFHVDAVSDGITGEEYALTGHYDIIILDIMLPEKNGLEIVRVLRRRNISTKILLLTAKSELSDKILGLDSGADDYLTKPFSSAELMARIRALTRRQGEYTGDVFVFGETVLNKNTYEISCGANAVKLGHKEYQILEILLSNASRIIPKELFIEKIWGYDTQAEYNAIEVYISFIRKKLVLIHADMQIKTVRGVGYLLEDADS